MDENVSTDGIEITHFTSLPTKEMLKSTSCKNLTKRSTVHIDVWDFAGQKVYYATHQLFLNKNALYLVVFNLLEFKDTKASLDQWLWSIKSRVIDPTIILVGTHLDGLNARTRYVPLNVERCGIPYVAVTALSMKFAATSLVPKETFLASFLFLLKVQPRISPPSSKPSRSRSLRRQFLKRKFLFDSSRLKTC